MNESGNIFRITGKQAIDYIMAMDDGSKGESPEPLVDPGAMLFVYVRETSAGRLVRVLHNDDANEFESDDDWKHVASIQPRAFIEQILNDNKAIFDGCFPK